jgi:Proteasome maturation factor UMP1
VQVVPHDALRQGLSALKQTAEVSHPVEAIQDNVSTPFCAVIGRMPLAAERVRCVPHHLAAANDRDITAVQDTCCSVQLRKQQEQSRDAMLGNIYGSALPARMQIERQILRKCVRHSPWSYYCWAACGGKQLITRNTLHSTGCHWQCSAVHVTLSPAGLAIVPSRIRVQGRLASSP